MPLFDKIPTAAATAASISNEDNSPLLTTQSSITAGFTHTFKFRPTDVVYTMTDNGIISATVLKVISEHRSIVSNSTTIESRVKYQLSNSMERTEDQLFDEQTAEAIKALLSV